MFRNVSVCGCLFLNGIFSTIKLLFEGASGQGAPCSSWPWPLVEGGGVVSVCAGSGKPVLLKSQLPASCQVSADKAELPRRGESRRRSA